MKTFMQWLEAKNIFWNGQAFQTKPTLGSDYEHYICKDCGRSFNKGWVDEMGPTCQCGGELELGSADDLDAAHDKYRRVVPNVARAR